ncbi:MAG: hypothetical protein HY804_06390 [Nitrospinae bacterium]|nr:hypothetical protein [Nitrospinota bacterium]
MKHTVQRQVIVQPGGLVEVKAPELTPGMRADVIIVQEDALAESVTGKLTSIIGSGRGGFPVPEDADKFIRDERDAWGK